MRILYRFSFLAIVVLSICKCQVSERNGKDEDWTHPLVKKGRLNSPLVEVEPFVFNNELYLLENWRPGLDWPDYPNHSPDTSDFRIWIAHLPNGPGDYSDRRYVSTPLIGNTFGTAIVSERRVYVFAVNEKNGLEYVEFVYSDDLITWSVPAKVFTSPSGEIFNVSLTRDDKGFVFLWETNGVGEPFTMCFGRVKTLTSNWNDNIIKDAVYGRDKYTGGPAIIYESGWYYLLYLEELETGWETRITRSTDLIHWQDAPEGRPFLTFSTDHKNIPLLPPEVREINASDPALVYYDKQVIVYFTGSNQQSGAAGDLQWATFDGTIRELMETFFQGLEPLE